MNKQTNKLLTVDKCFNAVEFNSVNRYMNAVFLTHGKMHLRPLGVHCSIELFILASQFNSFSIELNGIVKFIFSLFIISILVVTLGYS